MGHAPSRVRGGTGGATLWATRAHACRACRAAPAAAGAGLVVGQAVAVAALPLRASRLGEAAPLPVSATMRLAEERLQQLHGQGSPGGALTAAAPLPLDCLPCHPLQWALQSQTQ